MAKLIWFLFRFFFTLFIGFGLIFLIIIIGPTLEISQVHPGLAFCISSVLIIIIISLLGVLIVAPGPLMEAEGDKSYSMYFVKVLFSVIFVSVLTFSFWILCENYLRDIFFPKSI